TLQCIGWQHAEPVLRSLAYALLQHENENPAKADLAADRPGRRNAELARKIRKEWLDGKPSKDATTDLLSGLRTGSDEEVCDQVVKLLNNGVAAQSVWDAMLAGAGELVIRQPGIVALHAVTTTNALRYAYEATGNDETRRLLLLQNAAFLPLFRGALGSRGTAKEARIDQLEATPVKESGPKAVAEILDDVSHDRMIAARKTLAYLKEHTGAKQLIDAARVLLFFKGDNAHDYKFSSAVLEDYYHASPAWRNQYLAASMFLLRGSGSPDNGLVQRTRAALKA
ncbi:MAG TPA: hypothetical protein VKI65_10350, partial [Gemmataceae bacterium]|nr:hypothetical protein [Gemmataceae bacterium]